MNIREYWADLHIHTLLSPCAELEMLPSLIVEVAQTAGLDIIGIADHNSCENAAAVIEAAKGSSVKVFPGIEVNSLEGIHLLCLFDTVDQAMKLQDRVYEKLIRLDAASRYYKQQMVVDSSDEFIRYLEEPIALPTTMDINEAYDLVNELNGIIIPSHIDRHEMGLCGVLGMVPEVPDFIGVEISRNLTEEEARNRYPSIGNRAIFRDSDAHWLGAIGERRTALHLAHRTVEEIKLACRRVDGRRVGDA